MGAEEWQRRSGTSFTKIEDKTKDILLSESDLLRLKNNFITEGVIIVKD